MKKCLIVSVKEHKTGAKVTIDNSIDASHQCVSDAHQATHEPLWGGYPTVVYPSWREANQALCLHCGLHVQATESRHTNSHAVRKVGATAAALACGDVDRNLVAKQMSHSPGVDACYYEAVKVPGNTLQAYSVMEGLRKGKCRKLHSYIILQCSQI